MYKQITTIILCLLSVHSFAFGRDPIIVWPTEANHLKVNLDQISGEWLAQNIDEQNDVQIWNISLNKAQYAIQATMTNSQSPCEQYQGYLMPMYNAYYGILKGPQNQKIKVLLYQTPQSLKIRLFEKANDFEDYLLHQVTNVERSKGR